MNTVVVKSCAYHDIVRVGAADGKHTFEVVDGKKLKELEKNWESDPGLLASVRMSSYKATAEMYQLEIEARGEHISGLAKAIDAWERKYSSVLAKRDNAVKELVVANLEIEKLKGEGKTQKGLNDEQIKKLNEELTKAKNESDVAQKKVTSADIELAKLRNDLSDARTQVANLQSDLKRTQENLNTVKSEVDLANEKIKQMQKAMTEGLNELPTSIGFDFGSIKLPPEDD
jgi:chromosome segregation ATPase